MVLEQFRDIFALHFPFWQHLSANQQEGFLNNTQQVAYKKGDHVHSGNNDCNGVMFLKQGQLRVFMLSDEGREITIYRMFAGDTCMLSASCVLKNITFDVFIDAEDDSEILLLSSNFFDKLLNENIYVENYTYKVMADRFSDVMWAMQQILFISFDKRLARFLLDEFNKSLSTEIKLTHEQIAKYMGSAREVVSRMLKYFENEGFVELSRGGIKLVNRKGLEELIS
ncbi:MAG: Crp/Fnr family transcriptional regulator [Clostridia bacterium]|nr:Crp/Fnr family transcriptional regulator [Clostridia bacterium]